MSISSISGSTTSTTTATTASSNSSEDALQEALVNFQKAVSSQPTLMNYLDGSASSSDVLDLSEAAMAVADALNAVKTGSSSDSSSDTTIEQAQSTIDESLTTIQSKLKSAFQSAGIDTSEEIDLQIDSDGNVVVSNDNPQKAKIEKLFANNSDLKNAFAEYVGYSQIAESTIQNAAYQVAYAKNPKTAIQQYASLLNGSLGTVTLSVYGNTYTTEMQSDSGVTNLSSTTG